jgi:hypothetical protein
MKALTSNPKPSQNRPDAGMVTVQDESGIFEAWTPNVKAVEPYLGKDLPEGWQKSSGEYGPRLLPPRESRPAGPSAAYRNTKEGALAEQESIHRSVALQWACTVYGENWWRYVDKMYRWLSSSESGSTSMGAVGPGSDSVSGSEPTSGRLAPTGVGRPQEPDSVSGTGPPHMEDVGHLQPGSVPAPVPGNGWEGNRATEGEGRNPSPPPSTAPDWGGMETL